MIGLDPLTGSQSYKDTYANSIHFGRKGLVVNALSGIDVALWDIIGKVRELPVHRLLGGERERIRFYFNSGYYVDEDNESFLRSSIGIAVERGASSVKIKFGRDVGDDVRRIDIAREILGPERDLMVDAN